jgi:hypothetical protein
MVVDAYTDAGAAGIPYITSASRSPLGRCLLCSTAGLALYPALNR